MALVSKLNPPQLNGKLPAFYGNTIVIPFNLNRAVGFNQFNSIVAIVKTVSTSTQKAFLTTGEQNGKSWGNVWYDSNSRSYRASFTIQNTDKNGTNYFDYTIGQYYKIQIACVSSAPVDSPIGYYSSVGVIKCSAEPELYIQNLNETGSNKNTYEYVGVYVQPNDLSEKVYSYEFNLYDEYDKIIATTGKRIHNNSTDIDLDSSSDTWRLTKNLIANKAYYLQYKVVTMNGLGEAVPCESPKYQIAELNVAMPDVCAKLSAKLNDVEGYIQISLLGQGAQLHSYARRSGSFILLRSSSANNFDTWEQLTEFQLSLYDPVTNKDIYKDYVVEQGVEYIYAIQAYNQQGQMSGRLKNYEGKIKCDFEDAFLYDGDRQLKIRFNPSIDSFKPTILESKVETIGSKYPFIFRNGTVNYKEFSISGLLSLLGDENREFLQREEDKEILYNPTGEAYYKERQFKLEALEWLSNGKPKLFKSPAEGNYIVRLMNVSLSAEQGLGRLLHNFSCDACEIAEYSFEQLEKYDLIPGYSSLDDLTYYTINLNKVETQFQPPENTGSNRNSMIALPQTYSAKIVGTPNLKFSFTLANDQSRHSAQIGSNGIYEFSTLLLESKPLIYIELDNKNGYWGDGATLLIGYRDPRIKTFSYVHDVTTVENKVQLPIESEKSDYEEFDGSQVILPPFYDGKVDEEIVEDDPIVNDPDMPPEETPTSNKKYWMKDILKFLEDLRKKTGMFHFIKISKRNIFQLWYENSSLKGYIDSNGSKIKFDGTNFSIFDPSAIYTTNDNKFFYDGLDLVNNKSFSNRISMDNLTNYFAMGSKLFNMGNYSKESKTFTDISTLTNFRIGNGLKVDIIYQEKEIQYMVEDPESEYYNQDVVLARDNWKAQINAGMGAQHIQMAYDTYLNLLTAALKDVEEKTKVAGNYVIYAI